jgi:hypothetical protein
LRGGVRTVHPSKRILFGQDYLRQKIFSRSQSQSGEQPNQAASKPGERPA